MVADPRSTAEPATGVRYGPETALALTNFVVSDTVFPLEVVHAMARIKRAAARVHGRLLPDEFPPHVVDTIVEAAGEVIEGRWDELFGIDVFQTGSGTSSHMNVNEVIASIGAARGVTLDPHDQINRGQSSNDVVPSAARMAVAARTDELVASLELLERELGLQEEKLRHVVKAGRTHLRDATPITLGQEFGGYRQQVHDAVVRLTAADASVGRLPLGGTAVGNGINSEPGAAAAMIELLAEETGLALVEADDHFAVQGAHDDLVDLSGRVRTAAVALHKIANDIRLMASGPRTGFGELELESLQPGSSIMPGKSNPVIIEVVNQVVARVVGNDATITFAGAQGVLELNTYIPLIAHDLLDSLALLTRAARLLAEKVVATAKPHVEHARALAEATPAIATALTSLFGYEASAALVAEAVRSDRSIRDAAVEHAATVGVAAEEVDDRLDILRMALGTTSDAPVDLPGEDPHVAAALVEPADSGTIGPTPPTPPA